MSTLVLAGCSDIVTQQPNDLAKYPELKRFFKTCGMFESGTLDLDVGIMKLRFVPSITSTELFAKLDQIAESDQWDISVESETIRVYRKNLKRYEAQRRDDIVTIYFDKTEKIVEFEWK